MAAGAPDPDPVVTAAPSPSPPQPQAASRTIDASASALDQCLTAQACRSPALAVREDGASGVGLGRDALGKRGVGRLVPPVLDYPGDVGPGVYDIHSPRVPSADEIERLLELAEARIGRDRLWANPDCGLKTRGWPETEAALASLVEAAGRRRALRPAVA